MANDIPFVFGPQFQDSMLRMMMKDLTFADRVIKYVDTDHLHSDSHKWMFEQIKRKYQKDGSVPSAVELEDGLKKVEKHKVKMFSQFIDRIQNKEADAPEYIKDQLSDFAKKVNFKDLFAYGQILYNSGKTDDAYKYVLEQINHLHAISFKDDQIVSLSEFEAVRLRFINQRSITTDRITTGIKPLDRILRGGLSKLEGELGVVVAQPKKGKSIALVHMGVAALLKNSKCRVAHFVLEGSTETTIMRYQSRISGISEERISSDTLTYEESCKLDKIGKSYTNRLDLVPFNQHWEYTTGDVEAKLAELERRGSPADLVIIDYADLLQPREKMREERFNQREVYRDLKRIALMRKNAIWTAAQSQRPKDEDLSKETTLRSSSIAEAFEKVRIADFIGTLNQTPREKRMGILRFHADIYRNNACDQTIRLLTDFERMIFHHSKYGTIESSDVPDWMKKKKGRR